MGRPEAWVMFMVGVPVIDTGPVMATEPELIVTEGVPEIVTAGVLPMFTVGVPEIVTAGVLATLTLAVPETVTEGVLVTLTLAVPEIVTEPAVMFTGRVQSGWSIATDPF